MLTFIELEGIDSSGKTTLANSLAQHFEGNGKKVLHLGFPDHDSPTGKVLRSWLAKGWTTGDKDTDAMLFQCAQIVNRLDLLPPPDQMCLYDYIIVDRFSTSGLVYFAADGQDWEWLYGAQRRLPKPDISFHVKIPVSLSFERKGLAERDRYEEDRGYISKVADLYDEIFSHLERRNLGTGYYTLDGTQEKGEVLDDALRLIRQEREC